MKRLILIAMSVLMLLAAGCGSDVTVVLPIFSYDSPAITNYHYSQDAANSFVDGTVEFSAPVYDLDTITITVVNSRGIEVEHTVTSLGAYVGRSTGTISFTIDYINYRPDLYSFTIYLTDRAGYMTNPVYGSFRV